MKNGLIFLCVIKELEMKRFFFTLASAILIFMGSASLAEESSEREDANEQSPLDLSIPSDYAEEGERPDWQEDFPEEVANCLSFDEDTGKFTLKFPFSSC